MDSFDTKLLQTKTYWWITSLAISVICCSVLFVWFSSYLFEIKEEMAISRVRLEVTESRLKEMSSDLQMLSRRSTVQQIQIIPPGNAQAEPPASPAAAAGAAAAVAAPAEPPLPVPSPEPAKH